MRFLRTLAAVTVCALGLTTNEARAIPDPTNDFLPTYTGPQGGDLDVVSAEVALIGSEFHFTATLNGAMRTTPGALYAVGFNRGQGTALFQTGMPPIGSGVLFDSVVALNPGGGGIAPSGTVTRIVGGGTDTLAAGAVTIAGNTINAIVPIASLPSLGFTPNNFTWNLWPRVGLGQNVQVADFAPDNSNAPVVPEPTGALLALGMLASLSRRRRR